MTEDISKTITLPYIKDISEAIGRVVKKLNLSVVYCRLGNSLEVMLYNQKDKIQSDLRNGIYGINCMSCNKTYIGETKRYFKKRLEEHKAYVRNDD